MMTDQNGVPPTPDNEGQLPQSRHSLYNRRRQADLEDREAVLEAWDLAAKDGNETVRPLVVSLHLREVGLVAGPPQDIPTIPGVHFAGQLNMPPDVFIHSEDADDDWLVQLVGETTACLALEFRREDVVVASFELGDGFVRIPKRDVAGCDVLIITRLK